MQITAGDFICAKCGSTEIPDNHKCPMLPPTPEIVAGYRFMWREKLCEVVHAVNDTAWIKCSGERDSLESLEWVEACTPYTPPPPIREWWINLCLNGDGTVHESKEKAEFCADESFIKRIHVMADSSKPRGQQICEVADGE